MGPLLFDYGYGPFRWVCLSGNPEDLDKTDLADEITELESGLKDLDQGSEEAEELLQKLDWANVRMSIA